VKIIKKANITPTDIDSIKTEVALLKKLDSPSIVKYYESYEDEKYLYVVMEYCEGETLY
jgi:calcium-dependent protein kinase